MPIMALVEFRIVPERADAAREVFDRMLAQTRAFPGAERIEWLQDREDPTVWTLYEQWADAESELAYRAFRGAEGAVPELAEVIAGRPGLRRFDPVDF